jgi:hypothetical protein
LINFSFSRSARSSGSNATGVDGNEADNSADYSGAVYVSRSRVPPRRATMNATLHGSQ